VITISKKFLAIIAILVTVIISMGLSNSEQPISTETSTKAKRLIGFFGLPSSEFSKAKSLGAVTVQPKGYLSSSELKSALDTAKSLGLNLVGRAESKGRFQAGPKEKLPRERPQDKRERGQRERDRNRSKRKPRDESPGKEHKIDFNKLRDAISNVFSNTNIASDSNFLAYYIIDEPCHENKWDITPAEFRKFYLTVKEVNANIKVLVNFGHLPCLESFLTENKETIVDIATFTITPKKLKKFPDYIADQNAIAKRLKEIDPHLQIVSLIAVYEYPDKKVALPSADWVRQTGKKVLGYDGFDGIMYYSWSPSSYMGDTIEDIADNPEYISAFKEVFDLAKEKFNL